ncbi:MAG: glucose-1-phosphate adenylyltransferase [Candidatus Krumholzibacteria bacterium]|nr:glucose-1-phosphate adenylyltransferase [Candidatus Krumholzibacteria bacterium]
MDDITAVVLGGGRGTRLYPLTKNRSKPAVPLAGNYRLIDVPVSNCINSDINRIYVLTQFNSASLNQHVSETYRFDSFSRGFVEVLAAEQTLSSSDWFQGTADAVRQVMPHLDNYRSKDVLILSGDHLYRMDYREFARHHRETGADITIAVYPVPRSKAPDLGILRADKKGWITEFMEKPRGGELAPMKTDTRSLGLSATEARKRPYLGSMGIYIFRAGALAECLGKNVSSIDFAREIIPDALRSMKVSAYVFDGYWEDIGTIRSFYDAHMELLAPVPKMNLFDADFPIYTHPRFLPGSKIRKAEIERSMINAGCIIDKATIRHSIIGLRSRIGTGAVIEDSFIFGADFYELERRRRKKGAIPLGIGPRTVIRRAVIDKNVRIGSGVILENKRKLKKYNDPEERFFVRDGIIVVPKSAVIPDRFRF